MTSEMGTKHPVNFVMHIFFNNGAAPANNDLFRQVIAGDPAWRHATRRAAEWTIYLIGVDLSSDPG